MRCPYCMSESTSCKDSRQNGEIRWRRYECKVCNHRFSTQEVVTEYDYMKIRPEDRPHYMVVERKEYNSAVKGQNRPIVMVEHVGSVNAPPVPHAPAQKQEPPVVMRRRAKPKQTSNFVPRKKPVAEESTQTKVIKDKESEPVVRHATMQVLKIE